MRKFSGKGEKKSNYFVFPERGLGAAMILEHEIMQIPLDNKITATR
jgi:hypothetical protein